MKICIINSKLEIRDRILRLLTEQDIIMEFIENLEEKNNVEFLGVNQETDAILINVDTKTEKCFEIMKNIKQNCPNMLVFMFSGYKNDKYKAKCFTFGVDYYFDKPSDLNRMIEILNEKNQERNCNII